MRAAFSGTRIERKTIIKRMKLSATTAAMNSGRRPAMRFDRSMKTAVEPVTRAVAPVSLVAFGSTGSLRRWTRALVAASWGEDFGTTLIRAVRPDGLYSGGPTKAPSGAGRTLQEIGAIRAETPAGGRSPTRGRGPLKPRPQGWAN